jgi:hypothetical protein
MTCGKRALGVPRSLRQGLFQSGPFKKYFWRKMNRDRLLDTFKPQCSSRYDGRFRNWTQISDLALTDFYVAGSSLARSGSCSAVWLVAIWFSFN